MTHAVTAGQDSSSFDDDPEVEALNENMVKAGEVIEEKRIVDYWGSPETKHWYLPDGIQYFEYRSLTEGGKSKYERATTSDIRVQRTTGDSRMKVDPSTERHILIKLSTVGWNLHKPGKATGSLQPLPFREAEWDDLFNRFPAKILQEYYRVLREENEWMKANEDLEALEIEYENLGERIQNLKEEKSKKLDS